MNRESAVIKAANILGKASQQLRDSGHCNLALACDGAIGDLQASVAESRALDAITTGTQIHELIDAAIKFLDAKAYNARIG